MGSYKMDKQGVQFLSRVQVTFDEAMPGIHPNPLRSILREERRRCILYEPRMIFVVEAQKPIAMVLKPPFKDSFKNCKVTLTLLRKPPYQNLPVHACIKAEHQLGPHPRCPIHFAQIEAEMEHSVNNEGHHSIACRLKDKLSFFLKFTCSGFEQRGTEGTLWVLKSQIDYTSPITNGRARIIEEIPLICLHRITRVNLDELMQKVFNVYEARAHNQPPPVEEEEEPGRADRIMAAVCDIRGQNLINEARQLQQRLDGFADHMIQYYERREELNLEAEDVSSEEEDGDFIVIPDENPANDEEEAIPNLVPIEPQE